MPDIKKPEDPVYWDDARRAWYDDRKESLSSFVRYSGWFSGGGTDLTGQIERLFAVHGAIDANMLNLVTRASRAEMFYRTPRFVVEPASGLANGPSSTGLARVETLLLNDFVDECDMFNETRRVLLDMLLGPHGVFKIGYSAEIALDTDEVDRELVRAQEESLKMLEGRRPRVSADDMHAVHHEQHEAVIAAIERGEIEVPVEVYDYLKAHDALHVEALEKYGERRRETIRHQHVFACRRSPLRVFWDPWAERAADRDWIGEVVIRTMDDVRNDERYNATARREVVKSDLSGIDDLWGLGIRSGGTKKGKQDGRERVAIFEIVDLRNGMVRTYANGAKKMLREVPYKLGRILPAGPYLTASFSEDPVNDLGIAPPRVYESNQVALSLLETVMTIAARRSVPFAVAAGDAFTPGEIDKMNSGMPARVVPMTQLRIGQKINDYVQDFPAGKIPAELMVIADRHTRAIERYSGLGSAKAGGGDTANTATASAIIGESSSNLSEDLASVVDDVMMRVGRGALRLMRRFYRKAHVADLVGEEALQFWPDVWTERDILNDKGVRVIPGSTQRRNTAVQQKLLGELYAIVSKDPAIMNTPVHLELLRRLMDSAGVFGLDFSAVEQAMLMSQMPPEAQPGAEAGGPDLAERTERRAVEGEEPSNASIQQGTANPGGGRVPTGASAGDKVRSRRKSATRNAVDRGQ